MFMSPFIRLKRINLSYNILNNQYIDLFCDQIKKKLQLDKNFQLSIKELFIDYHSNINETSWMRLFEVIILG